MGAISTIRLCLFYNPVLICCSIWFNCRIWTPWVSKICVSQSLSYCNPWLMIFNHLYPMVIKFNKFPAALSGELTDRIRCLYVFHIQGSNLMLDVSSVWFIAHDFWLQERYSYLFSMDPSICFFSEACLPFYTSWYLLPDSLG